MVVLFVVVGAAVDVAFADVVVSVCLELWLFITKRQGEVTGIWQSNYLPGYIASNKWTQWIKRNLMKWIEMKWIVWAKLTSFLYHAIIPINYQMNSPRLNAIAGFWLINLNKYFIIRFLYLYVYLIFCTSLFVVTVVLCPFLQFNLIYVGDSSELIWMYTKLLPDYGDSVIVGSSDLLFLLQFYILQFWFVFFFVLFSALEFGFSFFCWGCLGILRRGSLENPVATFVVHQLEVEFKLGGGMTSGCRWALRDSRDASSSMTYGKWWPH